MRIIFLVICIIPIIFIFSCSDPQLQPGKVSGVKLDTASGMVSYLRGQHLPALEGVEVWKNLYGPGVRILTKHYELFTTWLDPLVLRQLPFFLESAHRGYNGQLAYPIESRVRFRVYLFGTRKQWDDFTTFFAGFYAPMYHKIQAGAYYLNGSCVAFNIGRERTFRAIGHEGWHQFNSRHFSFRLPSWLDEGIAMLFERAKYEDGTFYFEPGLNIERLAELKKTMIDGKMIPLFELTSLNPGELLATGSGLARVSTEEEQTQSLRAFYSQCYALVRFLREDGYGKRLGNYHRLLFDGLNGKWPLSEGQKAVAADRNVPLTVAWNRVVGPKLLKNYFGEDVGQIEQEYELFCGKIVYRIRLR